MIHFPGETVRKKKRAVEKRTVFLKRTEKTAPKKFAVRRKIQIIIIIGLGLILIIGWFFLNSNLFSVKQVQIEGEVTNELRGAINGLKGRNIFLLGNRKTSRELKRLQPSIDKLKIIRGFPALVRVEITQRTPVLAWENQGKQFLVDANGVAFKQAKKSDDLLLLIDKSPLTPEIGSPVSSPEFIDIALGVKKSFEEIFNRKLDHLEIEETTFLVTIFPKDGPQIKLDTNRSLITQMQSAKQVLQDKGEEIKEYIDPRIEGIVYYK